MKARATLNAGVEKIKDGWRLGIQRGDSSRYRDAQLDDYSPLPRYKFPHQSLTLSLSARASSDSIPGTWGFGLWNDPFRSPALPNAVWFFHASAQNYLSFAEDKPAQGFLAQTFRAPKFHPLLIAAGLTLPFSRRAARKLLSKVIDEDAVALKVDVTQRHSYQLEWSPSRVIGWVDNIRVFESSVSPRPPLGIIVWIDNQYAAFTPQGKIGFGILENAEPAWIEIENLKVTSEASNE